MTADETRVERATASSPDPDHGIRLEVGSFGPWQTNAYLVWDGRSTDALVLDPGMGATEPLMERIGVNGLRLHLVANSHGHIDHIFDNAPLVSASAAPLAIHPDDEYRLTGRNNYGFDLVFDVLHTPGHSEGSACLYEERRGLLLAGDVLFAGSYGRTDLPGGNDEQMVASLARLAREIPPSVRVLPGHGPETTIERELPWLRRIADLGRLLIPG